MIISEEMRKLAKKAESELEDIFDDIDQICQYNTERVLDVFREAEVSESFFAESTGYGYGDRGRDAIDSICAKLFGAQAGFMRSSIIMGTHAITIGLFGLLRPGDTLLSITGRPYDTLNEVIGIDQKNGDGSLSDFKINYSEISLSKEGAIDYKALDKALMEHGKEIKVVFLQRSKGYLQRPTLTVSEIRQAARFVHDTSKKYNIASPYIVVDNCYGEFTERSEPCFCPENGAEDGVDMIIGSMIKNPGGGMADVGGYIAGTKRAVELAGYRMCCPGVGLEAGATLGQNRNFLRGLFYAPHTVAQAMKTAHLAAYIFDSMGYKVSPGPFERRSDIIQTIELNSRDALISFCQGIQGASPVDAHVKPEPWAMPGYADEVIMAAGTFVSGASIELSCDGPMRPPYIAFLQGGLTYESGKAGIMQAAEAVKSGKN